MKTSYVIFVCGLAIGVVWGLVGTALFYKNQKAKAHVEEGGMYFQQGQMLRTGDGAFFENIVDPEISIMGEYTDWTPDEARRFIRTLPDGSRIPMNSQLDCLLARYVRWKHMGQDDDVRVTHDKIYRRSGEMVLVYDVPRWFSLHAAMIRVGDSALMIGAKYSKEELMKLVDELEVVHGQKQMD